MTTAIRLAKVSSGYPGKTVLHELDLSINKGEFIGLLGPNGSGKTTLLNTISGLLPSSGAIEIIGDSINSLSVVERARHMACVPQRFTDGLDMRVSSLVLMGRYAHLPLLGGYSAQDMGATEQAMRDTDTWQFRNRRAGELSGGELQRVVLARALAQETPILLLDEAASGMDMARKIEIFDLLTKNNRQGTTILVVIHDLNLAALYCCRLVFMRQGCIVHDGTVPEVFTADNLADVYGTRFTVSPHPNMGTPQAFYLPGTAHGSREGAG